MDSAADGTAMAASDRQQQQQPAPAATLPEQQQSRAAAAAAWRSTATPRASRASTPLFADNHQQSPSAAAFQMLHHQPLHHQQPPSHTAELCVFGEIDSVTLRTLLPGGGSAASVYVAWRLVFDEAEGWALLRGAGSGRSHKSAPPPRFWGDGDGGGDGGCDSDACDGGGGGGGQRAIIAQPLSFVLGARCRRKWPALVIEAFSRDVTGRAAPVGCARVGLPSSPGTCLRLSAPLWAPVQAARYSGSSGGGGVGSVADQARRSWFLGGAAQLVDAAPFVADASRRAEHGHALHSRGAGGRVDLTLHVVARGAAALPPTLHCSETGGWAGRAPRRPPPPPSPEGLSPGVRFVRASARRPTITATEGGGGRHPSLGATVDASDSAALRV